MRASRCFLVSRKTGCIKSNSKVKSIDDIRHEGSRVSLYENAGTHLKTMDKLTVSVVIFNSSIFLLKSTQKNTPNALHDASQKLARLLEAVGYNLYDHPHETQLDVVLAAIEMCVSFAR